MFTFKNSELSNNIKEENFDFHDVVFFKHVLCQRLCDSELGATGTFDGNDVDIDNK